MAGFLLFLLPALGFAQAAGRLDAILGTKQVTFAQAASVILPAAGLLDPAAGEEAAFAGGPGLAPQIYGAAKK